MIGRCYSAGGRPTCHWQPTGIGVCKLEQTEDVKRNLGCLTKGQRASQGKHAEARNAKTG
jgi:hypothetical protein